jgi:hypothetical protein
VTIEALDIRIQWDASGGRGCCWKNADDLPVTIREEIEAEVIDGGAEECDKHCASNGQFYRWW